MEFGKQSGRLQSLTNALKVAFAVGSPDEPFSPEDLNLLDRIATATVARGMASPALLFLESVGPMNFLGSQALHFLAPVLNFSCNTRELDHAASLLERRDAIPRLIALIEAKSTPGHPAP